MLSRRAFGAGLVLGGVALATKTHAQAWQPQRPIRLIVAYPAGGPTDLIARIVGRDITDALGQPVVVENISGASGAIGTRAVAQAAPDGHTITFGNNQTHGNNMFMLKNPGYDALRDFTPLAGVGAFEHVFVTRRDLPAASMQELIRMAKAEPGKLNYGSTGVGSGSHLSMELFMARTGTQMTHIPYRGAPPLVNDLLGGHVDLANSTLPSVIAQIKAGQLKGLALGSARRNRQLPDLTTLEEQGVTGANASSWTGFFAPAATPAPIVARLSGEIIKSLNKPEVVAQIDRLGFTVEVRTPEAFRPYQEQEIATWIRIARDARIQPEE